VAWKPNGREPLPVAAQATTEADTPLLAPLEAAVTQIAEVSVAHPRDSSHAFKQ